MVLVGLVLLANALGFFAVSPQDIFRSFLPLFFIGLGVWLIMRRKQREDRDRMSFHMEHANDPYSSSVNSNMKDSGSATASSQDSGSGSPEGDVGDMSDLGTSQRFYSSSNYEQTYQANGGRQSADGKVRFAKTFGELTADMDLMSLRDVEISMGIGDLEVRLKGGVLTDGLNRMIISGFLGDIRILVPQNIPLFVHCSNFVGDIESMGKRTSGFGNNIESQSPDYSSASRKLYIACNNFIGDIRIVRI
jgi:hypothetical protein